MRNAIKTTLACIAAFLCFQTTAHAENDSRILQADGVQRAEALSRAIDFYLDPTGNVTIETILQDPSYEFTALKNESPNFGFTQSKIWLRLKLLNTTPDVDTWYLHVHENFLQHYQVYLERSDGRVERLDFHDPATRFAERKIVFPELATALHIVPQESVTLYLAYASGGSSNISLALHTDQSFAKWSINQTSKNFISYGMMLILIVSSFLALLILRLNVILSYLLYVSVTLVFLMHADGVTFQYFWPNAPVFNSYFSIIIGLAFAVVPYNFARVFLRTKIYHPRLDKFMTLMMIVTPLVIIPTAFISAQHAKQILMLLVFFAILVGTFAGIIASLERFREVRFYVFAWVFGAASAGVMNLRHFTNLEISQNIELDSIRVSIVVDAIMVGLGVADRYTQDVKARRQADRESLQQAQKNLHLTDRLYDLETQYQLAEELVQTRDEQLKNTVHDLRQPLHALRLNVEKLRSHSGSDSASHNDLDTTFTYLETLIAGHLQDSVIQVHKTEDRQDSDDTALGLPAILQSIYEMFLPDALEKDLDFRFVNTSQSCDVEPLALMRIVTNLVSNAIKYTDTGKVLMGVRRGADGLRIEIHDTGTGLSQTQFSLAQTRSVRLSGTAAHTHGQGLGLSIASSLAHDNGLGLSILPKRQSGTSIALTIPVN